MRSTDCKLPVFPPFSYITSQTEHNHLIFLLHTHTITHTPCSPLREKHLLPLQCAEITVIRKERVGKQGMEREITSQDISLLMLGTGCSSTESPWSSRASLMHDHTQTRARTHTRECCARDYRMASSLRLTAER